MLAPVIVFWEGIVGARLIAPGDGHTYYLPLHELVADHWRAGVFPGWDRGTFAGSPLFGVHQSAALHPATLGRLVLPPVIGHNLTVVAALVVAGLGAHLLAHRLTGDHLAAAVAGCAFALCGFQFAHLGHVAIISTVAWLPWSLWAADRLLDRPSAARFAGGAAVVALAALSGHGQMLAYLLVATGLYALVVGGRRRGARVAAVGAMAVAGLALAAVQLVPVLRAIASSDRSALSHTEATAFSQDPGGLLVLIAPFLYGNARPDGPVTSTYAGSWTLTELAGYVGAAALVLAAAALPVVRRDRRVLALVAVAVGSTIVALGDSTPASHLVHAVPGFGQMRSWARYTVGAQLAVAVLAAVGLARARAGHTTVRPIVLAAGSVVAAVAVAGAPMLQGPRVRGAELAWAVGAPAAAALLATLGLALVRRHPAAAVALLALVVVDPVVGFGWWYRWRTASPTPAEAMAVLDGDREPPWGTVPDRPGGIDRYLWAGDPLAAYPFSPRAAAAAGGLSVTGMDPLAPADHLRATGTDYWGNLTDEDRLLGEDSHLLDLLRVTVVARGSGEGTVERRSRRPALPEAHLVGRTRAVDRDTAVAAAWGEVPLDPTREAVVEGRCQACPSDGRGGRAGSTGVVDWGPSSARVEVDADRPALLVLSQAWAPGWSATVDGETAPVVRANGLVQAVPVPAGGSEVVLRYRPPGLVVGSAVSALTAVGLAGAVALDRRRVSARTRTRGGSGAPPVASGFPTTPGRTTRRARRRPGRG